MNKMNHLAGVVIKSLNQKSVFNNNDIGTRNNADHCRFYHITRTNEIRTHKILTILSRKIWEITCRFPLSGYNIEN